MSVQSIYIALFGRPADPGGLAYWNEVTNGGKDLSVMLKVLPGLPEYTVRFEGMNETQVITTIYQNLFGRDPDPGGLAYFQAALQSGEQSFATIAVNILDGAQGDDQADVEAKEQAANLFTESLDTPEEIAAYTGDVAVQGAKAFLDNVDAENPATPESVQNAIEAVEAGDPTGGQDPDDEDDEGEEGPVDPGPTPDTTSPTLVIQGEGVVSPDGSSDLTFKFSEAVTGFTAADIAFNGIVEHFEVSATDPTTYTVRIKPDEGAELNEAIEVAAGSYTDLAGNAGAGAERLITVTDQPVILWTNEPGVAFGGFATIQAAINAAGQIAGGAEGYSITTGQDAPFNEQLTVNVAGLDIFGYGQTLNGGVRFTADAVGSGIHGFIMTGNLGAGFEGATIYVAADDVSVTDNLIQGSTRLGLVTTGGATGLEITGNTFDGFNLPSFGVAVYLNETSVDSGTVVRGNVFTNSNYGVIFENGPSASEVSGNTFTNLTSEDIEIVLRDGSPETIDVSDIVFDNDHVGSAKDVAIYSEDGATVVGTSGNDYFDDYATGPNNDVVSGGGGADIIVGGRGDDQLFGGDGSDLIWGDNPTNEAIHASKYGDDVISAGAGNNIVVLGTTNQNITTGGSDIVIVDGNQQGTTAVFNFNFGPVGEERPVGGVADQVFDVIDFRNVSLSDITVKIGNLNSAYLDVIQDAQGSAPMVNGNIVTIHGNGVYTGPAAGSEFELVITAGDHTLVFSNALSVFEKLTFVAGLGGEVGPAASLLTNWDTKTSQQKNDARAAAEPLLHDELARLLEVDVADLTSDLVDVTDHADQLLAGLISQGNFDFN